MTASRFETTKMFRFNIKRHLYSALGPTVLRYAVRSGRVRMTERLLKNGVDVNAADDDGMTPLLIAVSNSKVNELVPLLMEHGADVFAKSKDGYNALHHLGHVDPQIYAAEVARVLIEKGVSLNDTGIIYQKQPIHVAAQGRNNELVKLFLDHGANVNAAEKDLGVFTLYFAATRQNNVAVLETLLKRGANVNQTCITANGYSLGSTALHAACDYFRQEHIELLLSAGAYVHTTNHTGRTPLAILLSSAKRKHSKSVRSIIKVLALKKVSKPTIHLQDENLIRTYPNLWKHYQDCIDEINSMKSMRFIDTCTFFELFSKSYCQIAALMRNPEFETMFRFHDLNEEFPIHAEDIRRAFECAQKHYYDFLEQKEVINEAVYYILPDLVVHKVVYYIFDCCQSVK